MRFLDRLREISEDAWLSVSTGALAGTTAFAAFVRWFANTGEQWVWILDNANLAFHEAGHPIFGLIAQRLAVYGGTLGQLVFPAAATAIFWSRRPPLNGHAEKALQDLRAAASARRFLH